MSTSRRASLASLWWGGVVAALVTGCGEAGDDLPRQAVSGAVTFAGAPLKAGMIQFMPTEVGQAVPGGAAITDGRYALTTTDGLVPGSYQVAVTSASAQATAPAADSMPGDPLPPPKEAIPSIYNSRTTLTATVTKDGPNTFDFTLEAKADAPSNAATRPGSKARSRIN